MVCLWNFRKIVSLNGAFPHHIPNSTHQNICLWWDTNMLSCFWHKFSPAIIFKFHELAVILYGKSLWEGQASGEMRHQPQAIYTPQRKATLVMKVCPYLANNAHPTVGTQSVAPFCAWLSVSNSKLTRNFSYCNFTPFRSSCGTRINNTRCDHSRN